MKKFLKMIGIFSAILIIGAIALDGFISYRLRHSESRMFKGWAGVYYDNTDYDIVINGGSRAWVQYNPEIIDSVLGTKTYNLGIDGSSINRQIIKYDAYCRKHKTVPSLLIQNVDFVTICSTKDLEREQFFPYFFTDRDLEEAANEYENYSLSERFLPLVRYYGYRDIIMASIFNRQLGDVLNQGYCAHDWKWDGDLFAKQDTIHISSDSQSLSLFDTFLGNVMKDGTKVIFVYAPIYNGVNEKIPDVKVMYDMYEEIADKYDIPILNYNEIPMCCDTAFFYNATHLNKNGAEKFSMMLAEDIKSLNVLK